MAEKKLYPACMNCKRGVLGARGDVVFCLKKGIVGIYHSCGSFAPKSEDVESPLPASMNENKDIFGTKKDVSLKFLETDEAKEAEKTESNV